MDNHKPKISVIMPFYNDQKFLDQAIASIVNQTFKDFEFIIINDASTEDADKIVQKYLLDERIIYVKNIENQGIVKNLNHGLKIAKADIIARMDGDDVAEPARFSNQFTFLEQNKDIDVVGSFVKIIDENDAQTDQRTKPIDPELIKKDLIIYSPVVHPAVMFRKDVINSVGGYRQQYLFSEDIDLWYRVVYSGHKISNVPEFLLNYRYHKNSTGHQSTQNAIREFKLRKDTIKKFNLKLSLKKWFLIYLQLIVGIFLSGRSRQSLEGFYKKMFYDRR